MSRVDVHPEELIDAARRGEIDALGHQRLSAHLEHCTACSAELAVAADFAAATTPREGDDARLSAMVAGALLQAGLPATATGEIARTTAVGKGAAAKGILVKVAGTALGVGVLGGAVAALWMPGAFDADPEPDRAPITAPAETGDVDVEDDLPEPEAVAPTPLEPEPTEPVAEEETTEETAHISPEPEVASPEPAVRPRDRTPTLGAAEMLARANAARRGGDYRQAERGYRQLQRVHASSREAAVSRVTLGRLYLDGLGDPGRALEQFQRYLSQHPRGVLAEEARVGRALALGRLGRTVDERAAWRELLEHHPDSLHAERARSRLE